MVYDTGIKYIRKVGKNSVAWPNPKDVARDERGVNLVEKGPCHKRGVLSERAATLNVNSMTRCLA